MPSRVLRESLSSALSRMPFNCCGMTLARLTYMSWHRTRPYNVFRADAVRLRLFRGTIVTDRRGWTVLRRMFLSSRVPMIQGSAVVPPPLVMGPVVERLVAYQARTALLVTFSILLSMGSTGHRPVVRGGTG